VFGCFAGYTYWFPKVFGFKLNETLGRWAVGLWVVGFLMAFKPLYVLGFMGMTRRLNHYDNPAWHPWLIIAACGAFVIALGILAQLAQLAVSIWQRKENLDLTGDPWNARTLEWATSSPPPFYNFAVIPTVEGRDEFWLMKKRGWKRSDETFAPIHMPYNTGTGFIIGIVATGLGFAMIWHIWWLAGLSAFVMLAAAIIHSYNLNRDYYVPVDEVERIEQASFPQPA
jgi:cytochrome o ubiquinol oxidase subunit 1